MKILPAKVDGHEPGEMMYAYLEAQANRALDRRREAYEQLKTAKQIRSYQKQKKKAFLSQLGAMPRRTALNARIVGKIRRKGYQIAKLIYESQPRHYVTALLYLPRGKGPHPAVLVPPGHTDNGKIGYQRQCVLLATNGLAAMCIDPIGQGERHQIISPDGGILSPPTWEHTIASPGTLAVGRSVSTYMIWDTIRGLDYLCSRKEIDAHRIGCTGNSGGGMMTAYMMAIDDRIACAAPSCYITSYSRLLATIGPQDAEQNVPGLLAMGMDHADYLVIRAPKPTLICCATRDFFDIQGVWDTFRQAKRIYTRLGYANRVDLVETDWTHGFTEHLRVGMVRWMRRWLLGIDDEVGEGDLELLADSRLLCTPTGETMRLPGARSVFDVNRQVGANLAQRRRAFWAGTTRPKALAEVRRLANIRRLSELAEAEVTRAGAVSRKGCKIEKLIFQPESGIVLPATVYRPARPSGRRYLYLPGRGISSATRRSGPVEQLAGAGHIVLVADLRGLGATRRKKKAYGLGQFMGMDWQEATIGLLLRRPIVSQRAEDVLVLARYLAKLGPGRKRTVNLVATGLAGPAALHAAALASQLFESVELRRSLVNWSSILQSAFTKDRLADVIHGALATYDLDDLAACLGKKIHITEPVDAYGRKLKGRSAGRRDNPPIPEGIWTPSKKVLGGHVDQ